MDSKAQGSTEYLFAIVLSFFLTLIVLSSLVAFAGSTKQGIECTIKQCDANQSGDEAGSTVDTNVLFFALTIIVFYFVEFFFVVLFLRYIGGPAKKKLPKKPKY